MKSQSIIKHELKIKFKHTFQIKIQKFKITNALKYQKSILHSKISRINLMHSKYKKLIIHLTSKSITH